MSGRSGHSSSWRRTHENAQLQSETGPRIGHTMTTSSSSEPNIQGFAQGGQPQGIIENANAFNDPRIPRSSPRMQNDSGLLGHAEQPPVNRNNHVRRYGTVVHAPAQPNSQLSHDSERGDAHFKSRIHRVLAPFSGTNFRENQVPQLLPEAKSILETARALCVADPGRYNSEYKSLINFLVFNMAANFSSTDFEKSAYDDII